MKNVSPEEQQRIELVSPSEWIPPTPKPQYHLVVIGGGTAGLVTAAAGAMLGATVALVERHALGGDCLNTGCVPSKALLKAAKAAHAVKQAADFGIHVNTPQIDFGEVMRSVRKSRATVAHHDSAERFRSLGVDIFFGEAKFIDDASIQVNEHTLKFKKAVVATGARAWVPPVEGIESVGYLTHETVFEIDTLPKRLLVLGGGPIGVELAQAFGRLGSDVTLAEMAPTILGPEDPEAATLMTEVLKAEGIALKVNTTVERFEPQNDGSFQAFFKGGSEPKAFDRLLVATGRKPNVQGLGLDEIGVETTKQGITVNAKLQTTNPKVFAAGDVCLSRQFTHAADAAARVVVQNALFPIKTKYSAAVLPWCTYSSPEVAGIGQIEPNLKESNTPYTAIKVPFDDLDRSIVEHEPQGFVKILVDKNSDEILGTTIVGEQAGELISEIAICMEHGIGMKKIAKTIHPYPTRSEAIRKAADQFNRERLSDFTRKLLKLWFRWF